MYIVVSVYLNEAGIKFKMYLLHICIIIANYIELRISFLLKQRDT